MLCKGQRLCEGWIRTVEATPSQVPKTRYSSSNSSVQTPSTSGFAARTTRQDVEQDDCGHLPRTAMVLPATPRGQHSKWAYEARANRTL
jgi:hypothetical protein